MDPGAAAAGAPPPDSEPHQSSREPTPPPPPPEAAKEEEHRQPQPTQPPQQPQASSSSPPPPQPSRYESQKRRDWNTFLQYLRNHKPPLTLPRCSGAHVIEFLKYLDQFGKTKVHVAGCAYFGQPSPPAPCTCPLNQAWGSLDALIGRLRAAYEENGGKPESNPFGAKAVRIYLREVRECQAKARGIPYEKKKRKRSHQQQQQQQTGTARDAAPSTVAAGGAESTAGCSISSPVSAEAKDGGRVTKQGDGSGASPAGGDPTPPPPPPAAAAASSS